MSEARLAALAAAHRLPHPFPALPAYARIAEAIAARAGDGPLLVGVCGSQGSGKSTMAAFLAALLDERGLPTAILSIDDLYLNPEDRPIAIHPLFATRGPPATHDVALGEAVIDRLFSAAPGEAVAIPRFDKATDRRHPPERWETFSGPARVVILEGWFVGATLQGPAALAEPVNPLEADEDADGRWRGAADTALAGEYARLFARIGYLVFLAAPSFDCVFGWRRRQEEKLRAATGGGAGVMDDAALARFIRHYERLTRHLLATMPDRADALARLAPDQTIEQLVLR